jgi:hypothetical protein
LSSYRSEEYILSKIGLDTKVVDVRAEITEKFGPVVQWLVGDCDIAMLDDDFLLCRLSESGRVTAMGSDFERVALEAGDGKAYRIEVPARWTVCAVAREVSNIADCVLVPDASDLNTRIAETSCRSFRCRVASAIDPQCSATLKVVKGAFVRGDVTYEAVGPLTTAGDVVGAELVGKSLSPRAWGVWADGARLAADTALAPYLSARLELRMSGAVDIPVFSDGVRYVVRVETTGEIVPQLRRLLGTSRPRAPLFALGTGGVLELSGAEPLWDILT